MPMAFNTIDYGKMPASALLKFARSGQVDPGVSEAAREELARRGYRLSGK